MPSLPLTRSQALAIALALVVALVVAGRLLSRGGDSAAAPAHTFPSAAAPAAPAVPRLVVDVVGAVRRPGLYRLGSGARIADALERAGGATPKADLDQVNLAAPVADGEQVVVPRKTAAGAGAVAGAVGGAAKGPVQLSTATLEQLDSLPGIGPVTAQKILDYRAQHGAFSSVDELDAIPGIGPSRIDQLRGLVVP
jgi:competence protein ComEA